MTVTHGQNFTLRIEAQSTPHGLSPADPIPRPSNPAVVLTSIHGINVQYQAKASGHVQLRVKSGYCPSDPKISTCSVLDITVR